MATFTAFVTLDGKAPAEQLGAAMERLDPAPTGVGVFELEDGSHLWEVGGYFTEPPDRAGLALLSAAFGTRDFVISELPETDWVAHVRRELSPVSAGRFFVYGSHDADQVPASSVPLLIEASMAFGTGHHGTTLGCLQAFDRLLDQGLAWGPVADIGCGTGVLAMAAARLWDVPVIASDIDPVAVDVARANVLANGLDGQVDVVEAAGFDHPTLEAAAPYALVFANILKGPLVALAPDIFDKCDSNATIVLSGILNEQAETIGSVYSEIGFNLLESTRIVDWTTLIFRK